MTCEVGMDLVNMNAKNVAVFTDQNVSQLVIEITANDLKESKSPTFYLALYFIFIIHLLLQVIFIDNLAAKNK